MSDAIIAILPIAAVLALMLIARWSAVRAGATGLLLALVLGALFFPFESVEGDVLLGLLGAVAEAVFTAGAIIWIILPALAIYRLQQATGAVDALRSGLAELARDPRLTALLVAWFFALLLEGAAGFGTSAALAAPFLMAIGMGPIAAVVAAMIGHIVGVTFGAVGTPVVPMVAASGLEPLQVSAPMALQAALVGWSVPIVVAYIVARAYQDERPQPHRTRWLLGFGAAFVFLVPYLLIAFFVGPELPTLGGAIVGGAIFALALRRRAGGVARGSDRSERMSLARAMAPYLILVALVLATRLLPPLRDALRGVEVAWQSAEGVFSASIEILYHPGTMLFVALLLGALVQHARAGQVRDALAGSARQLVPVAAALLAMLGLARIMVHSGMVEAIAVTAADSVGDAWPLLAPSVGALGTFVTGSATASNALFSDLQTVTASAIGVDAAVVLGAQGLGAALGNAFAPHNLIAAAAIVGLAGRESEILRRTLPVAVPLVLAAGVVALLLTSR